MNFLAHIFLSGENSEIILGNFIGDFVKGNQLLSYPAGVRRGIKLHRAIDEYTDQHEVVLSSKKRLRPRYRHYAPVIVDMYYDHFLAKNWPTYHEQALLEFSEQFYTMVESRHEILPDRAQEMFRYMRLHNWLLGYRYLDGIHRALSGMSRRTKFDSQMEHAVNDLKQDYQVYENEFSTFFPDLINHSKKISDSLE